MTLERLDGMAIISIEHECAKSSYSWSKILRWRARVSANLGIIHLI